MDRKGQLRNVAFGGAWSEQIEGDEVLAGAMDRLDRAVKDTLYEDLRGFSEVSEALEIACAAHPKGPLLSGAWIRALNVTNAGLRSRELGRIAATIREGLGERAGRRGG